MSMSKPSTVIKMSVTSLAFAGGLYALGVDNDDDLKDAAMASLEVATFGLLLYLIMGAAK